jgi:hypothetical protein
MAPKSPLGPNPVQPWKSVKNSSFLEDQCGFMSRDFGHQVKNVF